MYMYFYKHCYLNTLESSRLSSYFQRESVMLKFRTLYTLPFINISQISLTIYLEYLSLT